MGNSNDDFLPVIPINMILGIALIVMAIMAFINPEENMVLFPLIFFIAALIRIIEFLSQYMGLEREDKLRPGSIRSLILGIIILILGVISAISIWT